jgi:hypothetical protein
MGTGNHPNDICCDIAWHRSGGSGGRKYTFTKQNTSAKSCGSPSTTSTFGKCWTRRSSIGVVRNPCSMLHVVGFAIRNGDTEAVR